MTGEVLFVIHLEASSSAVLEGEGCHIDVEWLKKSRKFCQNRRCSLRDKNPVPPSKKLEHHQYITLLGILNSNRVVRIVTTVF